MGKNVNSKQNVNQNLKQFKAKFKAVICPFHFHDA